MAKRRRFTPEFKAELVFEVLSGSSSQAELCRRHNLNENQLSEWKRHLLENASSLFASTDKQSSDDQKRIAHLDRWENGGSVRHPKKTIDGVGLTLSEKRCHILALQKEHGARYLSNPRRQPQQFLLSTQRGSVRSGSAC